MEYILIDLERSMIFRKLMFWKPNEFGYTNIILEAGLYSKERANEIVQSDIDETTIMVKSSVLKNIRP